jgi:alkylation response protein AidB-like acyl-CoA dehydrogenase
MQQLLSHEELRESFRELLSAESGSHAVRKMLDGDVELRSTLWAKMAELGWLGLAVEEKYGGLGLSLAEVALGYEELGRYLVPVPFVTTTLAAHAVALAGTEEQKGRFLPRLASGEISASLALALPEDPPPGPLPGTGGGDQNSKFFSNKASEQTTGGIPQTGVTRTSVSQRDISPQGVAHTGGSPSGVRLEPSDLTSGGVRLNGRLRHFVDANAVDVLLVPVFAENKVSGLAIVDRTAASVTVTPRPTMDRTRSLCDVVFDDVEIAPEQVLNVTPAHWGELLDHASVALACDSIGGATHILEKTVEYLRTRVQFNRAIGSFQALKHRCATWKILQEAASALTSNAAQMLAADAEQRASSASSAKFYACDAYAAIAGDAVQLHGGIGFTWEHDCHLFLKRAKLNQVLFGSAIEHRERVARIVLP